jgi:hypothetical protein
LTFLNAYNFDFYGKLTSNYVGVFNLYEPARDRDERTKDLRILGFKLADSGTNRWRWGFNTGLMKINYGLGDNSPSDRYQYENALIHALDSVVPGKKYLRQFNKYSSSITNSAWSFYCPANGTFKPGRGAKNRFKDLLSSEYVQTILKLSIFSSLLIPFHQFDPFQPPC